MVNAPVFYLLVALAALLIGLSKGGLGGSLGGLVTPLMALVMPPEQVIGLLLPILIVADIFAVSSHWRRWNWGLVVLLLPGAIAGVTIGTIFITNAPTQLLRTTLGVIILIIAAYKLVEGRIRRRSGYRSRRWHGLLAGTIAGFSSALAHAGGPPISIYLLFQDLKPRVFVATSAVFFATINLIKVPYYLYADLFDFERLAGVLWMLPLLPLGVWIGKWGSERISKTAFEYLISVFLIITALMLIFT